MAKFEKGHAKVGGRKKGEPNKVTIIAKEAIEDAYAHLQSIPGADFRSWALANQDDFYKLLFPKLLPVQMEHSGTVTHEVKEVARLIRHAGDRDSSGIRATTNPLPI